MFNFVSLLKYKRQMTGNKLCKPAQLIELYKFSSLFVFIEFRIR